MKRILVWTGGREQALCDALARLEGAEIERAADRAHALRAMGAVDGLITSTVLWDADCARELRRASRLVWIQVLNVGYDSMERLGVPERVVVSNLDGVGSAVVAEHAVAVLLALLRGLPVALEARARREWQAGPVIEAARTLRGLELAIVGFGPIGRHAAALAGAFGARVVAFARTARVAPSGIEVRALDALRESLPRTDAVVVAAPLNDATEQRVGAAEFAALRRGSYLVNVSRGRIVDTEALVRALRDGTLAGAALDVVDPEPLPASHPLWSIPNVILTPHTAWAGGGAVEARNLEALVLENAGRFARGESVRHVVSMRRSG